MRDTCNFGTVTRQPAGTDEMTAAILTVTPIGTQIDAARSFMERERFKCTDMLNQTIGNREGVDYLSCERIEINGWVSRHWRVAITFRDGKVTGVESSTYLLAP